MKYKQKFKAQDATIALTYRCNSRCRMCNIWQIKNPPDLPLKAIRNLSPHLRYINLSGGEPFLRADLEEIVEIIHEVAPRAGIILSSNGYLSDLIAQKMAKLVKIHPNTGVRISLDGLNAAHNRIRGIKDMAERAKATIKALNKIGVSNLGVSFTVMEENVDDLPAVYDWAAKNRLQFAMALVQNSDIYFGKSDNRLPYMEKVEAGLLRIVREELASLNPKRWARAFYDYGLLEAARGHKRLLKSGAGFDSLFIDPLGEVYPSNLINLPMGNIIEKNLDELWQSRQAEEVRASIIDNDIQESWIICTIRGEMKRNILKVLWWIATRKLKLQKL